MVFYIVTGPLLLVASLIRNWLMSLVPYIVMGMPMTAQPA